MNLIRKVIGVKDENDHTYPGLPLYYERIFQGWKSVGKNCLTENDYVNISNNIIMEISLSLYFSCMKTNGEVIKEQRQVE